MKTASFAYTGPGRISIARSAPRGCPAGYKIFKQLAPGPWFHSVSKEKYVELYNAEVLGKLDPNQVLADLCALAGPHEPVLLCWEKPPLTEDNWCHRQMVAAWFLRTLELDVPELEAPPPRKRRSQR